jgi:hypothetical protein
LSSLIGLSSAVEMAFQASDLSFILIKRESFLAVHPGAVSASAADVRALESSLVLVGGDDSDGEVFATVAVPPETDVAGSGVGVSTGLGAGYCVGD